MGPYPPKIPIRFTTLTRGVLLCGLAVLGNAPLDLHAQNAAGTSGANPGGSSGGGAAVDANVGDRDPLATSLRRVEPGNALHSFENRLTVIDFARRWSPFDPATPTTTDPTTGLVHSQGYQYRAPGVRALIDRPDYLVDLGGNTPGRNVQPVRDGAQFMLIPANTVFQLTPERSTQAPPESAPAPHQNYRDLRLDLQVHRVPSRTTVPFSQASIRADQPMPTLDLSQMRFPQLAAQATEPAAVFVDRRQTPADESPETDIDAPSPATE